MNFSNTIVIDRPVHDVFEYVANLANVPQWNYAIVETRKLSEGPVGVGSRYFQLRSLPSPSEESLLVTEYEPDRRFAVEGDLGPLSGTLTYEFQETDGATRLTNSADLEAGGLARLAAPITTGRIREAVAANLEVLKSLLESG